MKVSITERPFGNFEEKAVTEYTLVNENGMQVSVINYGGIVTKILTPDKYGHLGNVILGFDDMEGYVENGSHYIGAIVGRFCNRIADGKFSLNGTDYKLAINNKKNTLHGGNKGFDKVWWKIEKNLSGSSLKLTYFSRDQEEGYPGNLNVEVIYTLTSDNSLKIRYTATVDQPSPVNLTSHCYFNLSGGENPLILDHELEIRADKYTPVNEEYIPTGKIDDVKNTPMDFCHPKRIGRDIELVAGGYDFNYALNENSGKAASLYDPVSGRCMDMYTTEPGLQFYSGNFMNDLNSNRQDANKYLKHGALCLEAQHFPNSPNEPEFPDTILTPGNAYTQTTIYKFSAR